MTKHPEQGAEMCSKCGPGHSNADCPNKDSWEEAKNFWKEAQKRQQGLEASLARLAEFGVVLDKPEPDAEGREPLPNMLVNLSGTQEGAESYGNPWSPDRPAYGALPNFDRREEIVAGFSNEADYFGETYELGGRFDRSYAEGAMLFELKFEKRLSEFSEEILENYPDLGGEPGQEISLFGLSGSGKSTVVELMKEQLGDHVVVMDSDTVRYNLLAKMVKDVETENGASLEDVRGELMHNNISGSLYFLLNHVTKKLKERGYTILQSSTMPSQGADRYIYIEHPDGVDPEAVDEEDASEVARGLFQRTTERVPGKDDYNWESAETVTDFDQMIPVTVQVPEFVHGIFLKNLKGVLGSQEGIKRLKNPRVDDPGERERVMKEHIEALLAA